MKYVVVTVLFFSLLGCQEGAKEAASTDSDSSFNAMDYFYPIDKEEPYIYAYFDENAPLDERFHRLINFHDADGRSFLIERYNASLRIFEGFTLNPNSLEVVDHMMVDKNKQKRKSNVSSTGFFPKKMNETVRFVSDYPSHLDSLITVYDSRRTIIEKDVPIEIMDSTYISILLRDTIDVYMVNGFTKETGVHTVVMDNYFAKGMGLVQFGSVDGAVKYKLKSIISDSWWMKNAY